MEGVFSNLYYMIEDKVEMPPQWTEPCINEVEEIPLPTLEEVNCAVLKLKNN
jgi:hypothetical protein